MIRDASDQEKWMPLDVIEHAICDQCNEHRSVVVVCGEPQDWETATACVCYRCLSSAMASINDAIAKIAKRDGEPV